MIEIIIVGIIVLILAIIGIAKLAGGRGGGGGEKDGLTLEQLRDAVYSAKELINDVYSGKIGEAVNEAGQTGAKAKAAYDGLKQSEAEEMRKLELNNLQRERYLQLFRIQRIAETTAKYIKAGVETGKISEKDASEYAKRILGGFGEGEKSLYTLKKKVISD